MPRRQNEIKVLSYCDLAQRGRGESRTDAVHDVLRGSNGTSDNAGVKSKASEVNLVHLQGFVATIAQNCIDITSNRYKSVDLN